MGALLACMAGCGWVWLMQKYNTHGCYDAFSRVRVSRMGLVHGAIQCVSRWRCSLRWLVALYKAPLHVVVAKEVATLEVKIRKRRPEWCLYQRCAIFVNLSVIKSSQANSFINIFE